jgi:hypothetical protein
MVVNAAVVRVVVVVVAKWLPPIWLPRRQQQRRVRFFV